MVGVGGKLTFGQMSAFFPPQLVASEIKKIFLSSNLACLLAFEWRAARPHTLGNRIPQAFEPLKREPTDQGRLPLEASRGTILGTGA